MQLNGMTEYRQLAKMKWHKHFCWLPIRLTDGSRVWLQTVWRRGYYHHFSGELTYKYQATQPMPTKENPLPVN
jgi:hypothetical protein